MQSTKNSTYSGNLFTSFTGIVMILALLIIVTMPLWTEPKNISAIYIGITIFSSLLIWQSYYFIIEGDTLIVKNHFLFWVNRRFNKDAIECCVVTEPHRRATALKVICNNGSSMLYSAASLRKKTWMALVSHLKENRIEVKNESY